MTNDAKIYIQLIVAIPTPFQSCRLLDFARCNYNCESFSLWPAYILPFLRSPFYPYREPNSLLVTQSSLVCQHFLDKGPSTMVRRNGVALPGACPVVPASFSKLFSASPLAFTFALKTSQARCKSITDSDGKVSQVSSQDRLLKLNSAFNGHDLAQ